MLGDGEFVDEAVEHRDRLVEGDEPDSGRRRELGIAAPGSLPDVVAAEGGAGDWNVASRRFSREEVGDASQVKAGRRPNEERDVKDILRAAAVSDRLLEQSPELLGHDVLDRTDPHPMDAVQRDERRPANRLVQADLDGDHLGNRFVAPHPNSEGPLVTQGILRIETVGDEGLVETGRLLVDVADGEGDVEFSTGTTKRPQHEALDGRRIKVGRDELGLSREVEIAGAPVGQPNEVQGVAALENQDLTQAGGARDGSQDGVLGEADSGLGAREPVLTRLSWDGVERGGVAVGQAGSPRKSSTGPLRESDQRSSKTEAYGAEAKSLLEPPRWTCRRQASAAEWDRSN